VKGFCLTGGGMNAGAGVSFGLGANELGPEGLRLFWVGATAGGAVAAAEVVGAVRNRSTKG
jgi:hypothetical protein